MATIHDFWKHHTRASHGTRAAKRVSKSAVIPADFALSVESTDDHHSDGMLSRLSHLRTAQPAAPTSAAMASRVSQRSMIERNEVKSDMGVIMGPTVPKIKAIVSHDYRRDSGHCVLMAQTNEDIADFEWQEQFRLRIKGARGARSQQDMADLLCISRDAYSKYEGTRGTVMPVRLLPKFCKICAVSLEWLIEGDKAEKIARPAPRQPKTAQRR